MVSIVCEALRANKVRCAKCVNRAKDFATAGSLESFRSDPAVRVLVMPLGLGAEGLDLIVASHVYLLEPLLNVHQELQAVNRIHRVGQVRATFVHKYVLQGTIEERIVAVQEGSLRSGNRSGGAGSGSSSTSTGVDQHHSGHKKGKQARDDDLLTEPELRFILDLPEARVVGEEEAQGVAAEGSAVMEVDAY